MKHATENKARKALYRVLLSYLSCVDNYFSIEQTKYPLSKEIMQKFVVTARQLQHVIQSMEHE